ncbi:MAG: hypothetical protein M3Z11_06090 [Candidatus Dormibacteraeota bacterium]|nr:hypothetical protein [Candidatus Dormibacteraeota bacterium]
MARAGDEIGNQMQPQTAASRDTITPLLLVMGAVIGLVGNALHPHIVNASTESKLRAVADSAMWVGIHAAILVAVLLVIGGLIGFSAALADGPAAPLARLGAVAAVLGGALVSVSTSIDGFAMRPMAVAWASAPAPQAADIVRVARGVDQAGFGIWSIGMLVFFGAAFICLGLAANASGRFGALFGWAAVAGGVMSGAAALLQLANTGETAAAEILFLVGSIVITLWSLVLGLLLWRRTSSVAAVNRPLIAGRS